MKDHVVTDDGITIEDIIDLVLKLNTYCSDIDSIHWDIPPFKIEISGNDCETYVSIHFFDVGFMPIWKSWEEERESYESGSDVIYESLKDFVIRKANEIVTLRSIDFSDFK